MTVVVETERLRLRRLTLEDRDFLIELLNDPDFVRHIGDKGVRDRADARRYLEDGPFAAYARHGCGLFCVEEKASGEPVGICGLVRRDGLETFDLGFAYLARHRRRGYGLEAARATLDHARENLGLDTVLAITSPANSASIALLEKLGFESRGAVRLPGETRDCRLFSSR